MSPNNPKHAAIIAAYGDAWEKLSEVSRDNALRNEGFITDTFDELITIQRCGIEVERVNSVFLAPEFIRPIKLRGIEDNNGWTRIADDGSNLPYGTDMYLYCVDGKPKGGAVRGRVIEEFWRIDEVPRITHYQKHTPPDPPLY